jgi:hypothetical protein
VLRSAQMVQQYSLQLVLVRHAAFFVAQRILLVQSSSAAELQVSFLVCLDTACSRVFVSCMDSRVSHFKAVDCHCMRHTATLDAGHAHLQAPCLQARREICAHASVGGYAS